MSSQRCLLPVSVRRRFVKTSLPRKNREEEHLDIEPWHVWAGDDGCLGVRVLRDGSQARIPDR